MTEYKCGSAETCQFGEMCKPNYDIGGCYHFTQKKPQTNEEWLRSATTEEKAKFLRQIYRDGRDDYVGEWYEQTESDFIEWLKQPHKDTK